MLQIRDLFVFVSDGPTLDGIDLDVERGEVVAVVGPSGAGKTRLCETLLGRHYLSPRTIIIGEWDVALDPERSRSEVAWVPAWPDFPPAESGLGWLRSHCATRGRRMPEAVLRAALDRGGLEPATADRPLAAWTRSQRRRLALTGATLENTPVLLLDAPETDLDPAGREDLVLALRRLRRRGRAVLLTTRDAGFAERVATRVVALVDGRIVGETELHVSRTEHATGSYLAQLVG